MSGTTVSGCAVASGVAAEPMSETVVLRGPERPDLLRHEVLADIFETTAAAHPEQIALMEGQGDQLRQRNYAQLDAEASLAAHRLIEAGIRPGDMVGLWLPRGIELLTLQLAIAKTGAAWLPFDAETPLERIATCLEDALGIETLHHFGQLAQWAGDEAKCSKAGE